MIIKEKMKNMKIYRTPLFLPTVEGNKKKYSALIMASPNYEVSKKIMTHPLLLNRKRYESYYLHRDVSYYIGSNNKVDTLNESYLTEMKAAQRKKLKDNQFGIPSKRKFPLDTASRVKSAIKFFNYADEEDEAELAKNIKKAAKKFGVVIKAGDKNRLKKYIAEDVVYESEDKSNFDKNFKKKSGLNYTILNMNDPKVKDYIDKKMIDKYANTNSDGAYVVDLDNKCHVGHIFVSKKDKAIGNFEVSEKYKGYGVGEALLQYAVKKLGGNNLWLYKDNQVALNIYKKAGFKVTDKGIYKGDDYLVMELESTELDDIENEVAEIKNHVYIEETVDISKRNDIIYPIPDDMKNKREEFFYKNPTDGCYNACVKFDNLPNICRGRSEMVLIKDQKYILLQIKSNKESYRLPGGGWDPNETHQDAAIRETNEEALMEVKDVDQVVESTYIDGIGPVEEWVKKNVPDKSVWWSAYYTEVFVGTYDGKYTGKVDDVDKDDLAQRAKWYPINKVWDKLYPWHQLAIKQYAMNHSLDLDFDLSESVYLEACKDLATARKFVTDVQKISKKYNANFFMVTDGASGYSNENGGVSNPAVKNARNKQIEWEKEYGFDPDEDWSKNESTHYVGESVFVSHKDLEYNLNEWKPGKKNVMFVTGLSGSGKSTKARQLVEENNAINIPLDIFDHNENYPEIFDKNMFASSNEANKYRGWTIIGDYLKKYYGGRKVFDWNGNSYYGYEEYQKALSGLVDYILDLASRNPNSLYVVEGIALLVCPNERIFENPLIVKGTSMIISSWRKNKRDNDFNIIDILTYPKVLSSYMQWYIKLEKNKSEFMKNLKYHTEAMAYIEADEPEEASHKFRDVIVFDMGSVLVTYKNSKALVMEKIKNIPEELADKMVKYYYDSFDSNENATKKNLQDAMKAHFKDENVQDDWVKKVIDICLASAEPYDYTNDMLDDLKDKGYELYYLSNWGEASWTENKKKGNFKFLSKFKGGLVSYQAGFMKPSEDIYNLFLQKFDIDPTRCIFYDDKKENVVAADKVGIQGILFNSDSSPAEIGALPNIKVEDQYNIESGAFLREISDLFSTGDQLIFFGEDAQSNELKRILYTDRIKQRKDLLLLYDMVKKDLPFIKYTFPEMKKYMNRNIYIDTSYYMNIFFKNNKWVMKKGLNLFYDFFGRIINNKIINENGYKMKTIIVPVSGWTNNKIDIWNYKKSLNPMSIIYQLLYENGLQKLKKVFGNNDIIFINDTAYFKMSFSSIDQKEAKQYALKFKKFILKMINNEEFDMEDVDTSADKFQSSEVIRAELVDKIEDKTGVDLTANVKKLTDKDSKDPNYSMTKNNLSSIDKTTNTKKVEAPEEEVKKSKAYLNQKSVPGDNDIESIKDKVARSVVDISGFNNDIDDSMLDLDDNKIKDMITSLDTGIVTKKETTGKNKYIETMDENLKKKIVNGKTVEDIINTSLTDEEANKPVNLPIASPNEAWKDMKFINFDKDYNIDKDIILLFKFFATTSVPIVIKDIKAENNSTSEDRLCLYTVKMRAMPEGKQPHEFTVKLDIPIMEDNRFLLRGNSKSIQSQLFNMPIVKTSNDVAEISTLYHKIRVLRFGNVGRSTSESARFIKAVNKYKDHDVKITKGDNHKICDKYELPIDYIDLANYLNKIETKKSIFYFNQDDIREKYKDKIKNIIESSNTAIPIGYNKTNGNVIVYDSAVYTSRSLTSFILKYLSMEGTDFIDVFYSCARPTSSMYSRCSIMNTMIPTVVICAYHVGLRDVMNRAKITYRIADKLDKETRSDPGMDWIKFKDGYIVYMNSYEASMLMNGLKGCPTEEFELQYIDNPDMYYEFLDNFGGRIKADGLDNFYDLMIDPITKEYLEHYNLPNNYIDCLIYASNLLVDNRFSKHTNVNTRRIRRYEIVTAYTYEVLSSAYGLYNNELKHKRSGSFLVKQSAVIDKILSSNISSDDSCINALRDVETTNTVTTKGPVGMNQERAYSLDKRTFDDSMTNVVGLSTGFSGNVGIARQNTMNSSVNNNGGFIDSIDGDISKMNTVNTCTATEAIIPLGCTHDDPIRTSMSFIQTAKHMVRTEVSDPPLVVNGAEEAMAYMTTNRFAYKAKKDGKVVEFVENGYILIKYNDGTNEYINLKNEIMKNSDGGYYEPLQLTPEKGIKVGKQFKANEILAHDKSSFSNTVGESDNLAFNAGKLAKVAIINSDEGFEDSGCITERLAKDLTTKINVKYSITLDKETNVISMLKVGDHVEVGDALVTWQTAFDEEEANKLMKLLANNDTDISELGKRTLETEHTGVITDIKMFRTVDTTELSDSLKKIVNNYEKPIKAEAERLINKGIGKDKFRPYYKLPCTGKLKKAEDAVVIEYYVEYEDTVGVGDKVVYFSANKAEEKTIIPYGKEPYTDMRPKESIDAFVSEVSIDRRLVTVIPIVGALNKLLIELDRSVKDIMGIPYDDSKI